MPTTYIDGHLLKGRGIRQMGNGNMGAANTHPGGTRSTSPHLKQKCDSSQCLLVYPNTAAKLGTGTIRNMDNLQHSSTPFGRLCPLLKNKKIGRCGRIKTDDSPSADYP